MATDTTAARYRGATARVEGVGAWAFGSTAVGIAVGLETLDGHSSESRVPRMRRSARPGVAVGVSQTLADGRLHVGPFARWTRVAESAQILVAQGETQVIRIQGYGPPEVLEFSSSLPWHRRRDVDAVEGGLAFAGTRDRWGWTLFGTIGRVTENQWSTRAFEPPTDTWSARAYQGALEVAGGTAESGLLGHLHLSLLSLDGDAVVSHEEGPVFDAQERAIRVRGEIRWLPPENRWTVRGAAGVALDRRNRGDPLSDPFGIRSVIESRSTHAELEAGFEALSGLTLVAGVALAQRSPRGSIPRAVHYPRPIRAVAGAEGAFMATGSKAMTVTGEARWRLATGSDLVGRVRRHHSDPVPGAVSVELAPTGSFSGWSVELGVVLR